MFVANQAGRVEILSAFFMPNKIEIEKWIDGKMAVEVIDKSKLDHRDPDRFLTDDERRDKRRAEGRRVLRMLGGWMQ